ncbi:hypothetical protein ATL17_0999 [Maritalea mobilis]|uniref:Uncharacterized protein n=1 Tax=Maritalea mobilis TaxID=483324 RepID=A0A4R6VSH1_9HYPH|nr:hypothetical protein [Maritalea mobilis]TDQ66993.1 hypothetical protein ATL17_0999 [Maritalea mobilis]
MSSISPVSQPVQYVRSEPPAPPAKEKGEVEQLEAKKTAVEEFAEKKTDETKAPPADGTGRLVDIQV